MFTVKVHEWQLVHKVTDAQHLDLSNHLVCTRYASPPLSTRGKEAQLQVSEPVVKKKLVSEMGHGGWMQFCKRWEVLIFMKQGYIF